MGEPKLENLDVKDINTVIDIGWKGKAKIKVIKHKFIFFISLLKPPHSNFKGKALSVVSILRKIILFLWHFYFPRSGIGSLVAVLVLSCEHESSLYCWPFLTLWEQCGRALEAQSRSQLGSSGKEERKQVGRGINSFVESRLDMWNTLWLLIETIKCWDSQIIYWL